MSLSFQVFISKSTEFKISNKEFKIEKEKVDGKTICLNEIERLDNFQLVTCNVKVLSVGDPTDVKGGYRIQEIKIEDATGTNKLTVWEGEIGRMKEGESYRISRVQVKEFNGKKYLSTTKEGSRIEDIARRCAG